MNTPSKLNTGALPPRPHAAKNGFPFKATAGVAGALLLANLAPNALKGDVSTEYTPQELSAMPYQIKHLDGRGVGEMIDEVDPITLSEDPIGANDLGDYINKQVTVNGVQPAGAEAHVPLVPGEPKPDGPIFYPPQK